MAQADGGSSDQWDEIHNQGGSMPLPMDDAMAKGVSAQLGADSVGDRLAMFSRSITALAK